MDFHVTAQGGHFMCDITSDRDLANPVLCCSFMAPVRVLEGGHEQMNLGSYIEVALPDLTAGKPHSVAIQHADPNFTKSNRAWMPLGAYLRHGRDTIPLPAMPEGVDMGPDRPFDPIEGLRLIPRPGIWTATNEILIASSFTSPHMGSLDAARTLARRNNLPLFADEGAPLSIQQDDGLAFDSYELDITPSGVTLRYATSGGVLYGMVTLMTLLQTHEGAIPCGKLTDSPRFPWRGQHLDCARHFYSVDTILRLLDLMALCKLNRFHWHFADDEAFRLQIDSYPQLWQLTEYRGEGELLPGLFGGGIRSGGSYSKADVARVIAHAKALNIEVLPEIEVPAHALAMCMVFPELRDETENGSEVSVQGYRRNATNPAKPEMWDITSAIATEVSELFPFAHLHLGCDELAPGTWLGSPAAKALMLKEGLNSTDDLQGWTMARIAAPLAAAGIRPAAWEEAAKGSNGGIGNGAILFSWTGQGAGVAAARAGYDVVMSPAQNIYLDMAHTPDPDDWGANWAGTITLEDTIDWNPVPSDAPDIAERVIGVEGTFWSEFTTQDIQMEPMLAPRILGVAAKAWQADGTLTGAELRSLAGHYRTLFDQIGWARATGA